MIEIIYGEPVINFASLYLKIPFYRAGALGFSENGHILGGVIYDNYTTDSRGNPLSMEASVIILDKRVVNKYTLRKLFDYAFVHYGVKRLQIRTRRNEKKKRHLIERLGFRFEGILRQAWPYGGDATIYSMLKSECKWIDNGIKPKPTASARSSRNGISTNRQQSADSALSGGA